MGKGSMARSKLVQNVILVALIVYFLVLFISQQKTLDRNIDEYENIKEKTQQLSETNQEIRDTIDNADDEYYEKLIREKLGYVKPDEVVFIEK